MGVAGWRDSAEVTDYLCDMDNFDRCSSNSLLTEIQVRGWGRAGQAFAGQPAYTYFN